MSCNSGSLGGCNTITLPAADTPRRLKPEQLSMNAIGRLIANAAALWVASTFVPGISHTGSWVGLVLVALVFGVINTLIKPILMVLSLPVQVLTLGMFTFVVNALLLMLTGWVAIRLGILFTVEGFVPALLGSLVVSVVSGLLSVFLTDD